MKKLLLSLGTLTTIIMPIASIISCSEGSLASPEAKDKKEGSIPDSSNVADNKKLKIARVKSNIDRISKKNKPEITNANHNVGELTKSQTPVNNEIISKGFNIKDNDIFILDVNDNPTRNKSQILDAYNKFTKDINFDAAKSNPLTSLDLIGKTTKIDKTKKYIKIMIIGHNNRHEEVFFCGVMGFKPETTALEFLFRELPSVDSIEDNTEEGTFHELKMNPLPTESAPKMEIEDMLNDESEIVSFLVEVANQEFPHALVSLK